ncbi:hypothetical protein HDU93_007374 [Gonapodya sp. JEL0774]|nr:hypothetical protein HDU93_007374 [Gonapodya sp. JEL0774]
MAPEILGLALLTNTLSSISGELELRLPVSELRHIDHHRLLSTRSGDFLELRPYTEDVAREPAPIVEPAHAQPLVTIPRVLTVPHVFATPQQIAPPAEVEQQPSDARPPQPVPAAVMHPTVQTSQHQPQPRFLELSHAKLGDHSPVVREGKRRLCAIESHRKVAKICKEEDAEQSDNDNHSAADMALGGSSRSSSSPSAATPVATKASPPKAPEQSPLSARDRLARVFKNTLKGVLSYDRGITNSQNFRMHQLSELIHVYENLRFHFGSPISAGDIPSTMIGLKAIWDTKKREDYVFSTLRLSSAGKHNILKIDAIKYIRHLVQNVVVGAPELAQELGEAGAFVRLASHKERFWNRLVGRRHEIRKATEAGVHYIEEDWNADGDIVYPGNTAVNGILGSDAGRDSMPIVKIEDGVKPTSPPAVKIEDGHVAAVSPLALMSQGLVTTTRPPVPNTNKFSVKRYPIIEIEL